MLKRTLLHSGWSVACSRWLEPPRQLGYGKLGWLPAEVPGCVHLDLARHGVIADPLAALGELGCQWVDEEVWSYQTELEFRPEAALPRRVLRFDGLDTVVSVVLNGEVVSQHDNMFTPLEVDVTERLLVGTNELRLDFAPACRVGIERRARYFEQERLPPSITRFDERAFVRKAQYMYGWDWGPRLVSAGIWRPVALLEHAGRLLDVHVAQRHLADGSVELRLSSELDGPGEAVHRIDGVAGVVRDGEVVRLERPERWWPTGFGAQRLYSVTSWMVPEDTPEDAVELRAHDRRLTRVGLRQIELLRAPDRFGESFELLVNGRRLWVFGANWVPEHSFPSLPGRDQIRTRLEQARALGSNMLRVWGGGLYESDDFYELCDELGVLVWQDFAYACSYYPDDEPAREAARREAEQIVRRLRHHASLALWCGNNENATMFHDRWGPADAQPPRLYGEQIYDRVLPAVLTELDPARPYVPSSPHGGAHPNDGASGDQHYWEVWHGRGDWRFYEESLARFVSEFGFAAAPGHRAWRRALGGRDPANHGPRDTAVRWHDKTGKDFERFAELVELHYPPSTTLEEWIYHSQLNQRDALRCAIEHYRRSETCRGALVWQLNDCWPVQSWALIDSEGDYKAAAFEAGRLFAPLLLALQIVGSQVSVWTILDNAERALEGELSLEARSLRDGRLLQRWGGVARVEPDERRVALSADVSACPPDGTLLWASFQGATTSRLLVEPKHARVSTPRLSAWLEHRSVASTLDSASGRTVPDGRARFQYLQGLAQPSSQPFVAPEDSALILESDAPVVDLLLWDDSGELAFGDNVLTLPSAGRVRVPFSGAPARRLQGRSLAGRHTLEVAR